MSKRLKMFFLSFHLGLWLLGLVSLCLAGCAAPVVQTRIVVERVTIPPALLTCEAEPAVGSWTSQAAVGDYIVQLQEAGADCRQTVWAIAKIDAAPSPVATLPPAATK